MAARNWNEEDDDALVELWQGHDCLFNTSAKSYSDRNARNKATEEIALQLDRTRDEITKRMSSLRTSYSRLLKCPPSGSGRKNMTKRQDWLLKALEFIRPHIKSRDSNTSFQIEETQQGTEELGLCSDAEESEEERCINAEDMEDMKEITPSRAKHPGPNKRNMAIKRKMETEALESIAKSLSQPIEFPPPPDPPQEDECDIFGRLIATKLRKLDPRARLHLTNKINTLLFEAELASYGQDSVAAPSGSTYTNMVNAAHCYTPSPWY